MKKLALSFLALLLLVPALAPAAGAQAPAPAADPTPGAAPRPDRVAREGDGESLLFHVTLVAASREPDGGAPDDLPAGVAKALDDIRDFLPYRGYRVVDAALVRASREVHARLRGPGGEPFEAAFLFRPARSEGNVESYLVERFRLERRPSAEDLARMAEKKERGERWAPAAPMPSLDATFRIDRGETVVVGSSRVNGGDQALIVLLTAAP